MKTFSQPLTKAQISALQRELGDYLKLTIDVAQKIVVAGCVLYADGEKVLLEKYRSCQDDLWGGGIDVLSRETDATAVLNIRPRLANPSLEILDPKRRALFLGIVKEFFSVLWT